MREKRLDIATNTNYATGPTAGQPTKIAPPLANVGDGKIPGEAYGAQWQNYVEFYLQKQIEVSAIVPFRNWIEFPSMGSFGTPILPRFAFNKAIGRTAVANFISNKLSYIPEFVEASGGLPLTLTFAPAAGAFFPIDVAALDDPTTPSWIVVGANSTAATKSIWNVSASGALTELTSPVSGEVQRITRDKTTGYFYALAADTNRSVLVRGPLPGDTWSVLGQRGAGAPITPSPDMQIAAANGLLLVAYTVTPGSTQVTVERIATGAFSRTVLTPFSETTATLDVVYSPQMGTFLLLTKGKTHRFTDPVAGIESFSHTGVTTPLLGTLHETGPVLADAGAVSVVPWVGDAPHKLAFGDFAAGTTPTQIRFDGSAIWFLQTKAGSVRFFRSLRSN